MNNRNIDVLEHMVRYCDEIKETQAHFGDSLESLQSSAIYRNAVAMCIIQIGELSSHLSEDFKTAYSEIPWQKIKGMRNIAAHHYGKFDTAILYKTITERMPELHRFCDETLRRQLLLTQEAEPFEEPGESLDKPQH